MDKLSIGIIGGSPFVTGNILPAIQQTSNCVVEAIATTNHQRAHAIARHFGISRAYGSAEDMITDAPVQAVYVASPDHLHRDHVLLAAFAKKHILCEKPLATDVEECLEMTDVCQAEGVRLMPGFMMRFHPAYTFLREPIMAGRLGEIISMRVECGFDYPPCGNWRQQNGGALFDLGSHGIDLVHFLTGKETVAVRGSLFNIRYSYEANDTARLLLHLEGNSVATVDASFATPYTSQLEILGTKGMVKGERCISRDLQPDIVFQEEGRQASRILLEERRKNRYALEFEHFANCVLNGEPFLVTDRDGLAVNAAMQAAMVSDEQDGERVDIQHVIS